MRNISKALTLALLLTTIGCDRVTKHVASTNLAGTPTRSYFADTFRLEYAENPGAFLSLGENLPESVRTGVLGIGAGIGLIAIVVALFKFRWVGVTRLGALLFLSGGVSNLIDRIAHGRVIDFMNIGIGPLRTGIFNVADVALLVGIALLVLPFGTKRPN
jgi:signal peptidase II